jgi:anti-sigma factor (TIGR02949 family)
MPNRAECEAVVRQLWPFLDGAPSENERERIVTHLEGCVACTSHFDFARSFLEAVAAARPHLPANELLHARVLSALAGEGFRAH